MPNNYRDENTFKTVGNQRMSRVEKGALSEGPTRQSFADRFRERNNPKIEYPEDDLPKGFSKEKQESDAFQARMEREGLPGDDEAPGPYTRKDRIRDKVQPVKDKFQKPKIEYPEDDLPQ